LLEGFTHQLYRFKGFTFAQRLLLEAAFDLMNPVLVRCSTSRALSLSMKQRLTLVHSQLNLSRF
jgi:hypothetical protein